MNRIFFLLALIFVPVSLFAFDPITILTAYATSKLSVTIGSLVLAWLVGMLLKKIDREKLKKTVGKPFYKLGRALTVWQASWILKSVWNNTIEPVVITLLRDVVLEALNRFIDGLKSDNPEQYENGK